MREAGRWSWAGKAPPRKARSTMTQDEERTRPHVLTAPGLPGAGRKGRHQGFRYPTAADGSASALRFGAPDRAEAGTRRKEVRNESPKRSLSSLTPGARAPFLAGVRLGVRDARLHRGPPRLERRTP